YRTAAANPPIHWASCSSSSLRWRQLTDCRTCPHPSGGPERTMGKRSNFECEPRDFYRTPAAAVPPLLPHLRGVRTFAEPCCGDSALVGHLGYAASTPATSPMDRTHSRATVTARSTPSLPILRTSERLRSGGPILQGGMKAIRGFGSPPPRI